MNVTRTLTNLLIFSVLWAEEIPVIEIPPIDVQAEYIEEEPLVMQATSPGMEQPVINGLMGDKILITIDNNKFSNALFRSGPNQYYSWIPNDFVRSNTVNETLLNSSLGGTINRELGLDETGINIKTSSNTFTGLIKYKDDSFEAGIIYTDDANVEDTKGEIQHSSYNQKGLIISKKSSLGETKFLFTQSNDIDRTDKFQKGKYYVWDLQQYIMLSHEYRITDTDILIQPTWQRFKEDITKKEDGSKYVKSTNDIFGLNISDKRSNIFVEDDVFKYGIIEHYEDIKYDNSGALDTYYYNTMSLWTSYHQNINQKWDYTLTYNFGWMKTQGSKIDRSMTGNAFGISTNYLIDDSNFVFASVNSNFKFPTIVNLAEARDDSVEEIANPNLLSEKALTYRVGVSYNNIELSVFYKQLTDMIIREQTSIPTDDGTNFKWKYQNTDSGVIKGITFAYSKTYKEIDFKIRAEYLDGKTDYDYISKLQPFVTSTSIHYKGAFIDFLYAPAVDDDKMALKDKKDIRIQDHNYGYRILNLGYSYPSEYGVFSIYLDNALNDEGRVYGSSVDFNKRRVRVGYSYSY